MQMRWLLGTALVLNAACAWAQMDYNAARAQRKLQATRTSESITIDGQLNESAWAAAPKAEKFIDDWLAAAHASSTLSVPTHDQ